VELPALTIEHAAREPATPLVHKDPLDEVPLVQAREECLGLLATDRLPVDDPPAITVRGPPEASPLFAFQ